MVLCLIVSPIIWSQYFLLVAIAAAILKPAGRLLPCTLFAASWFVVPDRRWPFSPSSLAPPSARLSDWLAQAVLAAVVVAAAIPALRGRGASRP